MIPLYACLDAHAAVVCTEWPQITTLDPEELADVLAYPILVDGRNVFDPLVMKAAGIRYRGTGNSKNV